MSTRSAAMDEPRWGRALPVGAITLDQGELSQAAASLVPGEDPERGWTRYLRTLALMAMRRWLKQRGAAVVVGPEVEPEAPERLLAIQGLVTQLLCVSPLAGAVAVPLEPWQKTATAPQLLLLAQVDEDNGVVEFPGVLDAATVVGEIQKQRRSERELIELPVQLFNGGLERLLRWVTLLEPEALPRVGLSDKTAGPFADPPDLAGLQLWLKQLLRGQTLVPLVVLGARGGMPSVVKLISPEVTSTGEGMGLALAVCATPSIWAATPLAEILLESDGKVVWQRLASRRNPIEGPVPWPLEPLLPHQRLTVRLRPHGAPGGAYASVTLGAPDNIALEKAEEAIQQVLSAFLDGEVTDAPTSMLEESSIATEIRARCWLVLNHKLYGPSDG